MKCDKCGKQPDNDEIIVLGSTATRRCLDCLLGVKEGEIDNEDGSDFVRFGLPAPANQTEKIYTLEIEIKDFESAQWIWDVHRYCYPQHGIDVLKIKEGKMSKKDAEDSISGA